MTGARKSAEFKTTAKVGCITAAIVWCASAQALTIDYDPLRPKELRSCDEQLYKGREEPAEECYTQLFIADRNDSIRALAAWGMGDLAAANSLFRQYVRFNPDAVQARVWWGRLFLETHQDDDAQKLFREALYIDAANAQAKLGMAHIYARRF
jgi:tetratricopeptide (TPR) repeat protein